MSKWAAFAGSNGALVGAAGLVIAGAIGAGLYLNSRTPAPTPAVAVQDAPVAEPQVTAAAPADPVVTPQETPDANPPSIDEVRVEPDGLTVIAGRAAPGSKVAVLLDGTQNTETTTDDGGSFAAITILPPSPKAQVLTVIQRVGDAEIASLDEVILAPQARPGPVTEPAGTALAQAPDPVAPVVEPETPAPVAEPVPNTSVALADPVTPSDPPAPGTSVEPDVVALAPTQTETPTDNATATVDPGTASTPPAVDVAAPEPAAPAPAPETPRVATTPADAPVTETPNADAPRQVTVLKSTEEGVEVLGGTPPDALDNIELDTISYSQTGDVELSGRAQPEAEAVRVYVDNRPIAELDVDPDGAWQGALPEIDTGTYTLRVDELDAQGDVTSRVETPFRREDPEVLAQADNPQASATQITVQAGNTLWAIARDRYGEGRLFVQVFEANKDRIRNPDLIFPGQVFALPN